MLYWNYEEQRLQLVKPKTKYKPKNTGYRPRLSDQPRTTYTSLTSNLQEDKGNRPEAQDQSVTPRGIPTPRGISTPRAASTQGGAGTYTYGYTFTKDYTYTSGASSHQDRNTPVNTKQQEEVQVPHQGSKRCKTNHKAQVIQARDQGPSTRDTR